MKKKEIILKSRTTKEVHKKQLWKGLNLNKPQNKLFYKYSNHLHFEVVNRIGIEGILVWIIDDT